MFPLARATAEQLKRRRLQRQQHPQTTLLLQQPTISMASPSQYDDHFLPQWPTDADPRVMGMRASKPHHMSHCLGGASLAALQRRLVASISALCAALWTGTASNTDRIALHDQLRPLSPRWKHLHQILIEDSALRYQSNTLYPSMNDSEPHTMFNQILFATVFLRRQANIPTTSYLSTPRSLPPIRTFFFTSYIRTAVCRCL